MAVAEQVATRFWRRIDKVWTASGTILLAVLAFNADQFRDSLLFLFESWIRVLPFVAVSSMMAASIAATALDRPLGETLRRRTVHAVLLAGVFGALSPFCSVSVVPLVAGLLGAGVPLAPVMAFWVGSPLIDPEMFVLTVGIVDLPFALVRALTAILSGLLAGFLTLALIRFSWVRSPLRADVPFDNPGTIYGTGCGTDNERPVMLRFWRDPERRTRFAIQARSIAFFMIRWLTLAFVIESLLLAWVPPGQAAALLGSGAWWTVPLAAFVGIPTYLNGYAAVPVIAGLLELGMEPGAAIAFMIGGEVTSIPTAMAVFVVVRRKVFALYLTLGLGSAILMGWLTRLLLATS
ncbi:MAG: permease [Rhodospirillales bacterium]|nr:permease [Rhodospirillales bacterium]